MHRVMVAGSTLRNLASSACGPCASGQHFGANTSANLARPSLGRARPMLGRIRPTSTNRCVRHHPPNFEASKSSALCRRGRPTGVRAGGRPEVRSCDVLELAQPWTPPHGSLRRNCGEKNIGNKTRFHGIVVPNSAFAGPILPHMFDRLANFRALRMSGVAPGQTNICKTWVKHAEFGPIIAVEPTLTYLLPTSARPATGGVAPNLFVAEVSFSAKPRSRRGGGCGSIGVSEGGRGLRASGIPRCSRSAGRAGSDSWRDPRQKTRPSSLGFAPLPSDPTVELQREPELVPPGDPKVGTRSGRA